MEEDLEKYTTAEKARIRGEIRRIKTFSPSNSVTCKKRLIQKLYGRLEALESLKYSNNK